MMSGRMLMGAKAVQEARIDPSRCIPVSSSACALDDIMWKEGQRLLLYYLID